MSSRAMASMGSVDEPEMDRWPLALELAYGADRGSRFFLGEGMATQLVSGLALVETPELPGVDM